MVELSTEPINMSTKAFFTFINVYSYLSISKQKFSFMSEAKAGYLLTPQMSYSCMNISQLCNTKSLTKLALSYEVSGLDIITAPIILVLVMMPTVIFITGQI